MAGPAVGGGPQPTPVDLLQAYLDTDYRIAPAGGDGEVVLRIGVEAALPAPAPGRVHAVLSAGNPRSQRRGAAANRVAERALCARLDGDGLAWRPAVGVARGGGWPPEPSLWIRDIDRRQLDALAALFDQNACVVVDADRRARLRLYRPDWRAGLAPHPDVEWP
jgi:hypothetical protein